MLVRDIELRNLILHLKTTAPEIYREVFSRIYSEDSRFNDWRLPLWEIGNTRINWGKELMRGTLSNAAKTKIQQFALGVENNFPLFFVEPSFFYAATASGVPLGLKIEDLKLPYPSFTFILPKGALPTKYGDLPFITVTDDLAGRKEIEIGASRLIIEAKDNALWVSTLFPKNAGDYMIRVTDDTYSEEKEPDFHGYLTEDVNGKLSDPIFGDDVTGWKDITEKICTAVASLILAMECRPDIVTKERRIKQIRRGAGKEIWEPNRIGRGFRIKHENNSEPGEHSSPRAHPRRGHFRLTPFGPRTCKCGHAQNLHDVICMSAGCFCETYVSTQQKEKHWIEPVWVNLKKAA